MAVYWTAEQIEELNQVLADLRRRRRHSQLPFAQPRTGPIEFRVGVSDSQISVGGTGTISLWHRVVDEDDVESWEDSEEDVEAYDWRNAGPIGYGEKVHLHRHADSVGALWMIDRPAAVAKDYAGICNPQSLPASGGDVEFTSNLANETSTSDADNHRLVTGAAGKYFVMGSLTCSGLAPAGGSFQIMAELDGLADITLGGDSCDSGKDGNAHFVTILDCESGKPVKMRIQYSGDLAASDGQLVMHRVG